MNTFNAKNFNPHKKPISLFNMVHRLPEYAANLVASS